MKVFISYSHEDENVARDLSRMLLDLSIEHFLDLKDISWGDSITKTIRRGLESCTHIIIVISPASLKSSWVPFETGLALGKRTKILPFLTHKSLDVPGYLSDLHYATDLEQAQEYFEKERATSQMLPTKPPDLRHYDAWVEELSNQPSFTVQEFLDRVTDVHFVPDGMYVKGLVDRIPATRRMDTLKALFRGNNWRQADKFELVIDELMRRVTDFEVDYLLLVISEDLLKVDNTGDVTLVVKVLPDGLWPGIGEMARLRVERMLLDELDTAWYVSGAQKTNSPASTWIGRIAKHYTRKELLRAAIIKKLSADDFDHHNFVALYFLQQGVLPEIFEKEHQVRECVSAICDCVEAGNEFVKDCLVEYLMTNAPFEWAEEFAQNLADLTDPDHPEIYTPSGTPLLGKFVPRPNPVSEIPF